MANQIVKVQNKETKEVIQAGIEWFNLNKHKYELYKVEPKIEIQDSVVDIPQETVEELVEEEVVERSKKTKKLKKG